MDRTLDRKLSHVTGDLEPDEEILGALRATPGGELERVIGAAAGAVALGAVGFVIGTEVGDRLGKRSRQTAQAAGVQAGGADVLVVLTDRRLLVYRLGLTGRPKAQVAAIPRGEIAELTEGELRVFGQRMPAVQLTTVSGGSATFGVAKLRRSQLATFLQAYRESHGS